MTNLASKWADMHRACKWIKLEQQTSAYKINPNKIIKGWLCIGEHLSNVYNMSIIQRKKLKKIKNTPKGAKSTRLYKKYKSRTTSK